VRVIAIDGFPKMSSPGILRELDNLPIEYHWNTRAVLIDPEEARGLLDMHRKKWRSKIRGWKDHISNTQAGAIDRRPRVSAIRPRHRLEPAARCPRCAPDQMTFSGRNPEPCSGLAAGQ